MAALKTGPTTASVAAFLKSVDDARRDDCQTLVRIMEQATKAKPKMWGTRAALWIEPRSASVATAVVVRLKPDKSARRSTVKHAIAAALVLALAACGGTASEDEGMADEGPMMEEAGQMGADTGMMGADTGMMMADSAAMMDTSEMADTGEMGGM